MIFTEAFCPLPLNTFLYAATFLAGIFILHFAFTPFRAVFPTDFSFVPFSVSFLRLLQFLKAFLPIVFNPLPIVAVFRFVQPSKALFPIFVMLLEIFTFVSFLLFLKHFDATLVTRYFTPL